MKMFIIAWKLIAGCMLPFLITMHQGMQPSGLEPKEDGEPSGKFSSLSGWLGSRLQGGAASGQPSRALWAPQEASCAAVITAASGGHLCSSACGPSSIFKASEGLITLPVLVARLNSAFTAGPACWSWPCAPGAAGERRQLTPRKTCRGLSQMQGRRAGCWGRSRFSAGLEPMIPISGAPVGNGLDPHLGWHVFENKSSADFRTRWEAAMSVRKSVEPGPWPEIRMLLNGEPFLSFFPPTLSPCMGLPERSRLPAPPTLPPPGEGQTHLHPAPPRAPSPVYCCLLEQLVLI
ncbi:uncharacterized protein LOC120584858 isoform X2 [Pteropus medius]|uniref:uncharacterized protein LOC120584858 isoform X2 n=1 Tax=Pteropus vampyrus TaxID=132908 RepID=UPI00196B6D8F|nr:uncharacterized protein LOC120584858 isoform X2 [Pteropus giganteus]